MSATKSNMPFSVPTEPIIALVRVDRAVLQLQAWLNEMLNELFEDMFRYKGIFSIKAEEGEDFEVVFQVCTDRVLPFVSLCQCSCRCVSPCNVLS